MTAQDVTNHLNTLASDTPIAKKGWGARALHCWAEKFESDVLPLFFLVLPTIFSTGSGITLAANDGSFMFLLMGMASSVGCGAILKLARNKMARHYSSSHRQWDKILKTAQSLSAYDPQNKDVIKRVVQLIDDPRPTYRWTDTLQTLLDTWLDEEKQSHAQRQRAHNIELLTGDPKDQQISIVYSDHVDELQTQEETPILRMGRKELP